MSRRTGPTWPVFLVLGCLFVLSLTAPRSWEQPSRAKRQRSPDCFAGYPQKLAPANSTVTVESTARREQAPAASEVEPVAPPSAPEAESAQADAPESEAPVDEPRLTLDRVPTLPRISGVWPPTNEGRSDLAWRPSRVPDSLPRIDLSPSQPLVPIAPTREQSELGPGDDAAVATPSEAVAPAVTAESDLADVVEQPVWGVEPLRKVIAAIEPDSRFADWARAVAAELAGDGARPDAREWPAVVSHLTQLAVEARAIAAGEPTATGAIEARRAAYAIDRWVGLWQAIGKVSGDEAERAVSAAADAGHLALCLSGVEQATADADAWRQYLMVDSLSHATELGDATTNDMARKLARRVLSRLDADRLTPVQRQFLHSPAFAVLESELERWAAEPVRPHAVLEDIDRFEQTGLLADASRVAHDRQTLIWSNDESLAQLADQIEERYRLPNVRVVIGAELLARLSQYRDPVEAPVRETILGASVRGRSVTSAEMHLRLVPDADQALVALVARGVVTSDTTSWSGPATLFNRSDSRFYVEKQLELSTAGILHQPAQLDVDSQTLLRGVASNMDGLPLLGPLTRDIIRQKYGERRGMARRATEESVASKVQQQLESEAAQRLATINEQLRQHVLLPLERLELAPLNWQSQTTAERLTIRARLAADDQLAAFTPRPMAPAGSLASVQLHESALNNVLEQLGLAGRTMTLAELNALVREKLNLSAQLAKSETMPSDIKVSFTATDPVRVDLDGGLIKLTISFREIHRKSDHWRNFKVMVFYRPDSSAPGGQLVRDGVVQVAGHLQAKGQVAIRGIFSKIFAKDEPLRLIAEKHSKDPRLANLAVSQLVVADGWLGWALSATDGVKLQQAKAKPADTVRPPRSAGLLRRRMR